MGPPFADAIQSGGNDVTIADGMTSLLVGGGGLLGRAFIDEARVHLDGNDVLEGFPREGEGVLPLAGRGGSVGFGLCFRLSLDLWMG